MNALQPSTNPDQAIDLGEYGAQRAMWIGILISLLFTGVIWIAGQRLEAIEHLPDTGASWYYWKLPEATRLGRLTAWGFYALHQVSFWGLIYTAQTRLNRYSENIHRVNLLALGLNAFFILLHFLQTHLWYDGLAQDVSIWSSQASVVLLLVMVLLMENKRRGLFFGRKMPISEGATGFVRRYHGYFFSWAIVYTFWYHPMEPTSGHLLGFFYMFLLMLQGSLFFTRIHLNRWWMLVQEVLVAVHGTLVAVMTANGMWPMFFFGFTGIFVITQMHGLRWGLSTRLAILTAYLVGAFAVYSQRGLSMIHQVTWIPFIEYLAVFVLAGIIAGALWLTRRLQRARPGLSNEASG
ncbi:MAG: hypothetical protein E4G99_01455 [Anaerolineales bacterium]|nr:MAG: hypothetical protein E4G99_01455 [Anaerolineales bacterium]